MSSRRCTVRWCRGTLDGVDDGTPVERLTVVSDLGNLRFRPPVMVEAGSRLRVDGDVLVVLRPDGTSVEVVGERDERVPGSRYPQEGLGGQNA